MLGYLPTLEREAVSAELAKLESARAMSAKRPRVNVLVKETEDWTGADEVYLLVTGPGGASRTGVKSLNDGEAFAFALPIAPFGDFSKPVTLDVYDEDWPDADDLIVRMSWTPPFRPLRNSRSYDGAQYEVTASFD
jgi:hypothetical protein